MKILDKILALTLVVIVAASISPSLIRAYTTVNTSGGVRVFYGPTPISEGDAIKPGDLTVMNEYFVITFGWESTPPWGVPRGHIMDAAPIENGVILQDVLAQFSFLVNNWGNWIKVEELEIVENTSARAVIRASGYWEEIYGEIYYIVESGKNYMEIIVKLRNTGSKTYTLTSGFAISFKRGWTFIPGIGTARTRYGTKAERGVLDEWVAGYHEDFAVGLLSLNYTHIVSSTSWVDPLMEHTMSPGEEKIFIGYLIFETRSNLAGIVDVVNDLLGRKVGYLNGTVTYMGKPLDAAYAVIEKEGRVYTWATVLNGVFTAELPIGTYTVHAEARGFGPSSSLEVNISENITMAVELTDLKEPGMVRLYVYDNETGEPLDAQILITGGPASPIAFLTRPAEYTDPIQIGHVNLTLAPANYTLIIGHGRGFISKPVELTISVESGQAYEYEVPVNILIRPSERYWYSADLHHHSNILDGRTPPEYLVVAQSAAGLDFIFVSDHDSVANHKIIKYYADLRGMPFIPSVEVSPDWAHFNPYPIPLGQDLVYRGTVHEIFSAARAAGAIVIRVNHPFVRSGYFAALLGNYIPGGYSPDWDVAEINGRWSRDDQQTLEFMWELWNRGAKYYLTAGSDTHDIFYSPYTGFPRVYAYIPKDNPTPEDFAWAEKNGRTFISYGPLVFIDPLPGSTIPVDSFDATIEISLELFAVDGLSKIEVVSMGETIYTEMISGYPMWYNTTLSFTANEVIGSQGLGWIQVIVYDSEDDRAITNPIWVVLSEEVPIREVTVTTTETTTVTETTTIASTITEVNTITQTETLTETATYTTTQITTQTSITTTTTTRTVETIGATTGVIAVIAFLIGLGISYAVFSKKK
ncbi:MAG: CehA/McbA family metallohydrolase [Thermoprotei archaeon]